MHARQQSKERPSSWPRRWTRIALGAGVIAAIGSAAYVNAAMRAHVAEPADRSPGHGPPVRQVPPPLSRREVDSGNLVRLQHMRERLSQPWARRATNDGAADNAAIPTPMPLPRELALPPPARSQPRAS
jgi:hypothetical protein